jgi:hypothetical protein
VTKAVVRPEVVEPLGNVTKAVNTEVVEAFGNMTKTVRPELGNVTKAVSGNVTKAVRPEVVEALGNVTKAANVTKVDQLACPVCQCPNQVNPLAEFTKFTTQCESKIFFPEYNSSKLRSECISI